MNASGQVCSNVSMLLIAAPLSNSVASAARLTTNSLGSIGRSATAGGFRPATSPDSTTFGSNADELDDDDGDDDGDDDDRSMSKELY